MIPQKFLDEQLSDPSAIRGFFGEYRWLSNFHLCEIEYEGLIYPSTENAFQAAKFNFELRPQFVSCTPGQAKRLGKSIRMKREQLAEWDNNKLQVMIDITVKKYSRHQELLDLLFRTTPKHLEETNWWGDKFWGVCDGVGENNLGKIIMSARSVMCV
jgi:hypothetical protein